MIKFNLKEINKKDDKKEYDLIILGAGPAGLSAGIYAARYKLKTLVIGESIGGYASDAYEVENYPGFRRISGFELMEKFRQHAEDLGVKIKQGSVVDIRKGYTLFNVRDSDNNIYKAKALIFAMGTKRRNLNIPKENDFIGKGISYCATCDAPFYKDKVVGVVGGANAAVRSALLLAEHASKVYIIYRKDRLRAEPVLIDAVLSNPKIEVIYNSSVVELLGKESLEGVKLDTSKELKLEGLFVEIGGMPSVDLAKILGVKIDNEGYIVVNPDQSTNVEGIFAAGDITTNSNKFQQIITAAAEGAVAANAVYEFLKKQQV
ncbi:MAG: NAD(P)/FAD-dependent oxidoreductase [Candidatus Woesearchaeota archaeon]